MRISRIFMVLAHCAPHQPPRGRAAALGGPAAFNQIQWAPPGRAVRRGVCRSRFFPFAVAPAMGRDADFMFPPQLFPPAPIPRACHGPGWSGRIPPGAAAPAGLGSMAGGYDVCVFPVCGCACDIDWSQMRVSCFLPFIFPTGHPAGVPRFWVVRPNVFRCGGPRWAGKYGGGVCCLRFVP